MGTRANVCVRYVALSLLSQKAARSEKQAQFFLNVVGRIAHGKANVRYRYLKCIDKFFNNYISCFVTAANVKFLLLHQPIVPTSTSSSRSSTAIGANPTSPATEEAIKMFFTEVYDNWVKAVMNPFYKANTEVTSPVFRARVSAAGRKYL